MDEEAKKRPLDEMESANDASSGMNQGRDTAGAESAAKKAKQDESAAGESIENGHIDTPAAAPLNANDGKAETEAANEDPVSYQICVRGLTKATKEAQVRQHFVDLGVEVTRVKKANKWDYAFVTFVNREKRDAAMEQLAGNMVIKEQSVRLEAIDDTWRADKQQGDQGRNVRGRKGMRGIRVNNAAAVDDTRTPQERLSDQVTPLWRVPYADQLKEKTEVVHKVLLDVTKQLRAFSNAPDASLVTKTALEWVEASQKENNGLPSPLLDIVPSPIETHYRSKCEFSFGVDPSLNKAVGFLLGLVKDGFTAVLDASECLHVSKAALRIRGAMQEYIQDHEWAPYDRIKQIGTWRLLIVKTFWSGENQVTVQIHPQGLTPERIAEEKTKLVAFFQAKIEAKEIDVASLIWQEWDGVFNGFSDKSPLESLIGDGYVHEDLCGLRFRVSPLAFFQINTPATEKLYGLVRDWCGLSEERDTTLLDLCCGTGTIGLTMAKVAKKIIGVELNADAVKDAIANAEANGLKMGEEVEYICSKVEDALADVFKKISPGEKVVAVLDPPREGVHPSVTKAIRKCSELKQIVYVSCNPNAATRNFVDLCRPTADKFPGKPFRLTKAVPVDLFPQTKLVELVLFFDRTE